MHHLLYLSSATRSYDESHLLALHTQMHRTNQATGVSSLLLYGQGHFLQLLEGEHATLQQMLARIQRDVRHHELTPLFHYQCPERCFEATHISCYAPSPSLSQLDGFLPLEQVTTHCYRESYTHLPALQTVHAFAHQLLDATAAPVQR
ncbi:BLUF domain-containing protein [Hymenobacter sp. 5516J-16]|uniref:BLUF domain-containing protein n=1 Tax=Hymenobacter sublimis TaxID=2933777 RepID=A0ABY4JFZ8_9BACT|nr:MULTISPECIES: BLUF domain-containing protein [Hymenobacter]UOQ77269.1 BLUF domain-containing protein [Hymenobacter sp. 5516J-16]UPL50943.1 BLUF domain-containing protein [Hymenobacter sublimis]